MDFWLGRIVEKTGVPYTLFFGLIGVFLYKVIFFTILIDNLNSISSEPRWVLVVTFGTLNGIE